MNMTENLDDPEFCRAVVLSLRTYLAVTQFPDAPVDHLSEIAFGRDASTKAFIEMQAME